MIEILLYFKFMNAFRFNLSQHCCL